MSTSVTISRIYAKAAFDFAVERQSLDHWQRMLTCIFEVTKNKQIKNILSNRLTQKSIAKLLIEVCFEEIDRYGRNFIKIMAHNGRLNLLPNVLKEFINFRMTNESVVEIDVISAYDLSKEQLSKINTAMEHNLSKRVLLKYKHDKFLIGGVIIRLGDFVINSSIRSRIECFSTILQS